MILAPASSCIIKPEVTMGEIPSSIRVPKCGEKHSHGQERKTMILTSVGSKNDTHPVQGIGILRCHDSEQRNLMTSSVVMRVWAPHLAANKEDEQCDSCPQNLFLELDLKGG